jgi:LysM repeat protein
MASTIGIKIANGKFYSVIDENSIVKKRLVLTTVHDEQRSVQIDLYKSATKNMADALYIGSLVVENIKPKPKGDPSIEMVISSTQEGEIIADAIDLDAGAGGEHQILNVSLKSFDEDNREYEIPDYELEQPEGPPAGLYETASGIQKMERGKKFPWVVLIIGLVIILLCLALWFFILRGRGGAEQQTPRAPVESALTQTPAPPAQPAAPVEPAAPVQTASPPPVIEAPAVPVQSSGGSPAANRSRPPAPVSTYKVPATIPRDGAPYKIRWGDTLWDISEAFYRNPWLYPRIARFNNIRNPDRIISGVTIRIPPRN